MASKRIDICLETGRRLTFASALEWPGWARSGRGEETAIAALGEYRARYVPVVAAAGLALPADVEFDVVERAAGSASTDFGVPGAVAQIEHEGLTSAELDRLLQLLEACWSKFDGAVVGAPPILRKGPRGGGRNRDQIWEHVVGAEAEAYAPRIGVRVPRPALGDASALRGLRRAVLAGLRERAATPRDKGWPVRYAIRRIAWHVLDHAWEIEDRGQAA